MERVAITGVGLVTALGTDPGAVAQRIAAGESAVRRRTDTDFRHLPDPQVAMVDEVDVRRHLKRRKDLKLLPRAAELALPAAMDALKAWEGPRPPLGLHLAVGREPPDDGESQAALLASVTGGQLDVAKLASAGRDLYPPLLPLKTLPNMVLAHISINADLCGDNGAWAGGVAAGDVALRAAYWAVIEGRCPAALVGGADSLAHVAFWRDRQRMGVTSPPGEAAAMLLFEPPGTKGAIGSWCPDQAITGAILPALGDCGAATQALRLLLTFV